MLFTYESKSEMTPSPTWSYFVNLTSSHSTLSVSSKCFSIKTTFEIITDASSSRSQRWHYDIATICMGSHNNPYVTTMLLLFVVIVSSFWTLRMLTNIALWHGTSVILNKWMRMPWFVNVQLNMLESIQTSDLEECLTACRLPVSERFRYFDKYTAEIFCCRVERIWHF